MKLDTDIESGEKVRKYANVRQLTIWAQQTQSSGTNGGMISAINQ